MVRNPHARRYVLRLQPDGSARVTIPRGGSLAAAREFAGRHETWLERQLQRLATRSAQSRDWLLGAEILFRGERVKLEAAANGESDRIHLSDEVVKVADPASDLR